MQKLTLSILLALGASLAACDQPKSDADKPATTQATPAFIGTYKGVLPCASCAGIETTLELNADGSYRLTTLFLEVPDAKPETVTATVSPTLLATTNWKCATATARMAAAAKKKTPTTA